MFHRARKPFSWRAAFRRLLIQRILIVALYVVLWQVPVLKEWRAEQYARAQPLLEQAVSRFNARRVANAPPPAELACAPAQSGTRGQGGSIQFHRPGGC